MTEKFGWLERWRAHHEAEGRALDRMETHHFGGPLRRRVVPPKAFRTDPHRRATMSATAREKANALLRQRGATTATVMEIMERGVERNAVLGAKRPAVVGMGRMGPDGILEGMKRPPEVRNAE